MRGLVMIDGTVIGHSASISVIDEAGCVVPTEGVQIIRPRSMGKITAIQQSLVFNHAPARVFEHTFVMDDKIKPGKQRRSAKQRLKGLRP